MAARATMQLARAAQRERDGVIDEEGSARGYRYYAHNHWTGYAYPCLDFADVPTDELLEAELSAGGLDGIYIRSELHAIFDYEYRRIERVKQYLVDRDRLHAVVFPCMDTAVATTYPFARQFMDHPSIRHVSVGECTRLLQSIVLSLPALEHVTVWMRMHPEEAVKECHAFLHELYRRKPSVRVALNLRSAWNTIAWGGFRAPANVYRCQMAAHPIHLLNDVKTCIPSCRRFVIEAYTKAIVVRDIYFLGSLTDLIISHPILWSDMHHILHVHQQLTRLGVVVKSAPLKSALRDQIRTAILAHGSLHTADVWLSVGPAAYAAPLISAGRDVTADAKCLFQRVKAGTREDADSLARWSMIRNGFVRDMQYYMRIRQDGCQFAPMPGRLSDLLYDWRQPLADLTFTDEERKAVAGTAALLTKNERSIASAFELTIQRNLTCLQRVAAAACVFYAQKANKDTSLVGSERQVLTIVMRYAFGEDVAQSWSPWSSNSKRKRAAT